MSECKAKQLVRGLRSDNPEILKKTYAEISRRLRTNKINFHFWRLICGFRLGDQELTEDAYKNIERMVFRYLNDHHQPDFTIAWNESIKVSPHSEWDSLFHQTVFGDGLEREGEYGRYANISWEQHLINGLCNRYSGLLTRIGQRRKDEWRQRKLESPKLVLLQDKSGERRAALSFDDQEISSKDDEAYERDTLSPREILDAPVWTGQSWENIIAFDADGPVYDSFTYGEREIDLRWGLHPTETEEVFLAATEIFEFMSQNIRQIKREIGETGMWTWIVIAKALANGGVRLEHLDEHQTRRELLDLLAKEEGITKRGAQKRLRRLGQSKTIKRWLKEQIPDKDKKLPQAPTVIGKDKVGRRKFHHNPPPAARHTRRVDRHGDEY